MDGDAHHFSVEQNCDSFFATPFSAVSLLPMSRRGPVKWIARLLAILVVTASTHADDDISQVSAVLRAGGVDSETTRKVIAAIEEAADQETIEPLKPFAASNQLAVAGVATSAAILFDEETGLELVRQLLERSDTNHQALFTALCVSENASTVDFLVSQLDRFDSRDTRTSILFSLQVLTGREFTDPEEWRKWWADRHESFRIKPWRNFDEFQRRTLAAAENLKLESFRKILSSASPANEPIAGKLGRIFEDLAETMQAGAEVRRTKTARQADRAFANGALDRATAAYRKEIAAQPDDLRSRYLLACLLLNAGNNEEAADLFDSVARADPAITSAAFLANVARRQIAVPTEKLLESATAELEKLEPKPEITMAGCWPDPLVMGITGQTMRGEGIFSSNPAHLERVLDRHPDDPELAVGLVMLALRPLQPPALAELAEQYPDAPIVQWALLSRANTSSQDREKASAILHRLRELDPQNGAILWMLADIDYPRPDSRSGSPVSGYKFPPEAIQLLAEAVKLPQFEIPNSQLRAAKLRALEAAGIPWRIHVFPLDAPEGILPFAITRLVANFGEALEAGDMESAERYALWIDQVSSRLETAEAGMLSRAIAFNTQGQMHRKFAEHFEKLGESKTAEWHREQKAAATAAAKRFVQLPDWLVLAYLPVPRLQAQVVEQMTPQAANAKE